MHNATGCFAYLFFSLSLYAPSLQVRCIISQLGFGAELTLTHKQSGARSINLSFNLL